MSHYTSELRYVCENYAGLTDSEGYTNIADIIEKARPKVFDFQFPIFDEDYRPVLETKIIKHFYTREIGAETVGLWKHFLDRKMNEIMPYYNQLYASEKIKFDPMQDTDYTIKTDRNIKHDEDTTHDDTRTDDLQNITKFNQTDTRTDNLNQLRTDNLSALRTDNLDTLRTDNTKSNTKSSDDTTTKDAYSDTPQGVLTGVEGNTYLTNYRKVDGTDDYEGTTTNTGTVDTKETGTQKNDNTGTQSIDNTGTQVNEREGQTQSNDTGTQRNAGSGTRDYTNIDDYLEHVAGKRSTDSYSKYLQEFRDTFLNIDMMIIDDLKPLFMNIW